MSWNEARAIRSWGWRRPSESNCRIADCADGNTVSLTPKSWPYGAPRQPPPRNPRRWPRLSHFQSPPKRRLVGRQTPPYSPAHLVRRTRVMCRLPANVARPSQRHHHHRAPHRRILAGSADTRTVTQLNPTAAAAPSVVEHLWPQALMTGLAAGRPAATAD